MKKPFCQYNYNLYKFPQFHLELFEPNVSRNTDIHFTQASHKFTSE